MNTATAARRAREAVVVAPCLPSGSLVISIIIPVLNEAGPGQAGPQQAARGESESITDVLSRLPASVETIVVDGGSTDDTRELVRATGMRLVTAQRGRANQMNAGAALASGEVLLFLHADTRLPDNFLAALAEFERSPRAWGRFDVRLSGSHPMFRVIERMMNWRSRLTGICTGDQAIFVRRSSFVTLGGFAPIPLMEDIEISRRLLRISRPFCVHAAVTTSSRRWERRGILKTILLMWRLRLAYFLGARPEQLARRYYG
ncbi:MAG: TIGR04283 family arsenosugar biosynthesis glycosyltransferase [Pseudomonadota bacterium]